MLASQLNAASTLRLANSRPLVKSRHIQRQAEEGSSASQATAPATPPPRPAVPPPRPPQPSQPAAAAPAQQDASLQRGVTIEFQRQKAKEMVQYFRDQKQASINDKKLVLGWTPANEINNGRWVMIGIAVGLLTEFATGVDFIEQLKLIVSYLGLLDLE